MGHLTLTASVGGSSRGSATAGQPNQNHCFQYHRRRPSSAATATFSVAPSTPPVIRIQALAANSISIVTPAGQPDWTWHRLDSKTTLAGTKPTCCAGASFGSG